MRQLAHDLGQKVRITKTPKDGAPMHPKPDAASGRRGTVHAGAVLRLWTPKDGEDDTFVYVKNANTEGYVRAKSIKWEAF